MSSPAKPLYRVFLSSVFGALNAAVPPGEDGAVRDRVEKAIRELSLKDSLPFSVEVSNMEAWVFGGSKTTWVECLDKLETCDLLVGIIGPTYGEIPDLPENSERVSFTEAEFLRAEELGIPLLLQCFRIPISSSVTDAESSQQRDKRLELLKRYREVKKSFVPDFKDVPTLLKLVKDRVEVELHNLYKAQAALAAPLPQAPTPAPTSTPVGAKERQIRIGGRPPFQYIGKKFKNRQETLAKLMAKIADPATRVVLIGGRGGIGKSQCAAKLCEIIHEPVQAAGSRFTKPSAIAAEMGITGVVYRSFRQITGAIGQNDEVRGKLSFNRDTFLLEFLAALPETEAENFQQWRRMNASVEGVDIFRRLLACVTEGHVLVVFDNFEDALDRQKHIQNESLREFFLALLEGACPVTVLITTRLPVSFSTDMLEATRTGGAIYQPRELERLPPGDCVDLLRELDEEADGRAKIRKAETATVERLAEACHGIPRALDLAVNLLCRQPMLTPIKLLQDLKSLHGDVLNQLLKDCWAHVSDDERDAAKALAILGRPATAAEVKDVLGEESNLDAATCLNSLASTYLLTTDAEAETYLLHELDRRYLLDQIPADDVKLLHRAAAAAAQTRQGAAYEVGPGDLEPWNEAFDHYLQASDLRAAWNAISSLVPKQAWDRGFHWQGLRWLDTLLPLADASLRPDLLPAACRLLAEIGDGRRLLQLAEEWTILCAGKDDQKNLSRALSYQGTAFQVLARFTEAEPIKRRALAISESSFGLDHPEVADHVNNLAVLLLATKRLAEAEPMMRRALAISEASYETDHPEVATRLNNLAQLLKDTNRLAEAEPMIRRALAIDEASYGPDHPNVAYDLSNLAGLLKDTNRLPEAEPMMRRVLVIDEASYGPDHPAVASDLINLAGLLRDTNRLGEAEPMMRRALAIDEASYGSNHPEVAADLNNLARLLTDTNRLADAEPMVRRALAIDEATYGPDHPDVATRLNSLAYLLKDTNRLAEAEPMVRRALAIAEASYGPDHPNVAVCLNSLAYLLKDTNRPAEAEPMMRRALAIYEASYGPDHPYTAISKLNLGVILAGSGQGREAVERCESALRIDLASLGTSHWYTGEDLRAFSAALLARGNSGDSAEALAKATEAVANLSEAFSPTHWRIARALRALAAAQRANALETAAVESLRRALAIYEGLDWTSKPWRDLADTAGELAEALEAQATAARGVKANEGEIDGEEEDWGAAALSTRNRETEYRRRFEARETRAREEIARDPQWPYRTDTGNEV